MENRLGVNQNQHRRMLHMSFNYMWSKVVYDVLVSSLKTMGIILVSPILIVGWTLINIVNLSNGQITAPNKNLMLDVEALNRRKHQQEQGRLATVEFYSRQQARDVDIYNTQQRMLFPHMLTSMPHPQHSARAPPPEPQSTCAD